MNRVTGNRERSVNMFQIEIMVAIYPELVEDLRCS